MLGKPHQSASPLAVVLWSPGWVAYARAGQQTILCGMLLFVAMLCAGITDAIANTRDAGNPAAVSSYAGLPIAFIRNEGQIDERVEYYEQGERHASYFTREGVYFTLEQNTALLRFIDADKNPSLTGHRTLPSKVNYFIGSNPERWVSGAATYAEVLYKDVYPGVDIRFYGAGDELEYDVIVAPGADPAQIEFAYEGVEGLQLNAAGELIVQLPDGELKQKRPIIYQQIGNRRIDVEGRFQLLDGNAEVLAYSFELGRYDAAYPLIIDPILGYSTYLGGSNDDRNNAIAVDASGHAYVAGTTRSTNFPVVGGYQATRAGGSGHGHHGHHGHDGHKGRDKDDYEDYDVDEIQGDIIISKFDPSGSTLLYSTYLGGNNTETASSIEVDDLGNIYVVGFSTSSNYPVTASAYQSSRLGNNDVVVSKLNAAGDTLLYSSYLGGNNNDQGNDIAVDTSGNAYIAGTTLSASFPVKSAYQATKQGDYEAFVAKLDTNASGSASLVYSTFLGGGNNESANGIAIDSAGRAYVTGFTESKGASPFPVTASAYQSTRSGNDDVFVSRLSPAGNGLEYSSYLGGKKDDAGYSIAVDNSNIVYVTGDTRSNSNPFVFPTTAGAYQTSHNGNRDAFVVKIDTNASGSASLVYSTFLGANNNDSGYGIVIDTMGNAYVTGYTKSFFPVTASAYQATRGGMIDAFFAQLNNAGDTLLYSTYIGGKRNDYARSIAIDLNDNVYIAGYTRSAGTNPYPTTAGAYQQTNAGDEDGFITKFDYVPPLTIESLSLLDATQAAAYSSSINFSGGVGPYSWSVVAGALPDGLSLNGATGEVSGTPTGTGTANFTIQVTDAYSAMDTQALSLIVNVAPVIDSAPLAAATQSSAYSQTLTLTGGTGPFSWTVVTGTLPAGLTLNSTTGEISGTPTGTGTANFTIQVSDANTATDTLVVSIVVNAPPVIDATPLPGATQSSAYSQTLALSDGTAPFSWSVISGTLPAGLTLNSTTGEISGTPNAAGTANFTIQVSDANLAIDTQALSIVVNVPPVIDATPLAAATQSAAYSQALTLTGGTGPFSWSVVTGSLPAGLTLNSTTGVISGAPTGSGTANFTIQVSDANAAIDIQALSIAVNVPPVIDATPLIDATQSAAYSQTLTLTGGTGPYSWSVVAGTLPAGLTLNSTTGVISGTPIGTGTANFTIQVSDANTATDSQDLSIVVNAALVVDPTPLPGATQSIAYSQTLSMTGGTGPFVWSVVSGTLPAGLTLNTTTGAISGTPTGNGIYNFTVQVTDATLATDTQPLSIVVNAAPVVDATPLPSATQSTAYSQTLALTGGTGPMTWSVVSGSLPAGLSLNSTTGVISGTATGTGPSNFTVQVIDANAAIDTQALSIHVNAMPVITTTTLATATQSSVYSHALTLTGGTSPVTWSIAAGTLPGGLFLNSSTGVISGTPNGTGTFNFTVQVTDANAATDTQALSLVVNAVPPVITTLTLAAATQDSAYSQTLTLSGGTAPLSWSVVSGTLPAGLNLNSSTGVISGIPTENGTFNFSVQVSDATLATDTQALSLIVNATAAPPVITTSTLATATVASPYNQTLMLTGGTAPLNWVVSAGTLPAGLSLNSSNGVISGTPAETGTSNFTIQVSDATLATDSQALSITVVNAPPVITTILLSTATQATPYSQMLTLTGGTAPFIWSVSAGALPPGLTLNSSTGVISGTPTAAGTVNFTIQVSDANSAVDSQGLSLVVDVAAVVPPVISTSMLAIATQTGTYSQTLTLSGGTAPLSWAVSAGALPAGLSLNNITGEISGIPTGTGTSNFTIQVTDANSTVDSQSLSLLVNPVPVITTNILATAMQASPYNKMLTMNGGTAPFAWAVSTGTLPAGLALNSSTGVISGTPTGIGISNFTIQVTDTNSVTDSQLLSITVNAVPPVIITSTLAAATQSSPYTKTLVLNGGTAPLSWVVSAGSLPAGLTLNSSSGVISGTPTVTGVFNFTIQVTDANLLTDSQALGLLVNTIPLIDATTLTVTDQASPYSKTFTVTGGTGPFTWGIVAGSLPVGLSLNSSTGVINGIPTGAGTSNFTIQVTDANSATDTLALSLDVNAVIPVITTSTLVAGTQASAYSQTLIVSGGTAPLSWAVLSGNLPTGLSINSSTGVISGIPTGSGTSNFTVQVTDATLVTDSQALSLVVNAIPLMNAAVLPNTSQYSTYNQALTLTGGTAPFTWSIASGSLPAGLSLNSYTGVISGTPMGTGTSIFTVQVTDANSATSSQALSISVYPPNCTGTPEGNSVTISPHADVDLTFTSVTASGSTCAEQIATGIPKPAGFRLSTPSSYLIITEANYSNLVEVCLDYNPLNFDSTSLKLFHFDGASWVDTTTSIDTVNHVICGLTPSFSPFAIGEPEPTAITLTAFSATRDDGQVVINWQTRSEIDNWGFRILRSDSPSGPFAPINDGLIPARGGVGLSMSYNYSDTTAEQGRQYYYQLQDVDSRGLMTAHNAVSLQDPVAQIQLAEQSGPQAVVRDVTGVSSSSTSQVPQENGVVTMVAGFYDWVVGKSSEDSADMQKQAAETRVDEVVLDHVADKLSRLSNTTVVEFDGADPVYKHKNGQPVTDSVPAVADKPSEAFSVTIKDDNGHVIDVTRVTESSEKNVNPTNLTVSTVGDKAEVSWQVAKLQARGFALYRTEQGKDNYLPVMKYIPNYGEDDSALYNYRFTDGNTGAEKQFNYRLEVLTWGVQVVSVN